jgi:hypothetical protein
MNKIFSGNNVSENELHLQCPVCGNDYNHVVGIVDTRGNGDYPDDTGNRQGSIQILIQCEVDEHLWKMYIGQHKGYVFLGSKKQVWESIDLQNKELTIQKRDE